MKMKNIFLLSLLCLPLFSCNNNEEKPSYVKGEEIRVTFHLNGGNLTVNNQIMNQRVLPRWFFFAFDHAIVNKLWISNFFIDISWPKDIYIMKAKIKSVFAFSYV